MTVGVRTVLSSLAVAFTAYLAVGAMVWTTPPAEPLLLVAAIGLYLMTTWLCIFWNVRTPPAADVVTGELGRPSMLPGWAAVLSLAVAVLVPNVSWLAAGEAARLDPFATWSLGGVGALMAIVMVRRRAVTAWAGVALVAVSATAWIGPADALALGLVGAVLWVGVAQLLTGLVDRAARDTAQLTELQRAASEWLASQEGIRRARRAHVRQALTVAGPVLGRTIESGGRLDDDERMLARIAEGTLRDELRGAALLDDDVRERLEVARLRGATVTVVDEGGLEKMPAGELQRVRAELAAVLGTAGSERLYIRTSTHPDVAVTVVGRSLADDGEEGVDLWHEIARHPDAR